MSIPTPLQLCREEGIPILTSSREVVSRVYLQTPGPFFVVSPAAFKVTSALSLDRACSMIVTSRMPGYRIGFGLIGGDRGNYVHIMESMANHRGKVVLAPSHGLSYFDGHPEPYDIARFGDLVASLMKGAPETISDGVFRYENGLLLSSRYTKSKVAFVEDDAEWLDFLINNFQQYQLGRARREIEE